MINEITSLVTSHYSELLAIIGGVVSVATIIVKLTPTTKDDEILDKVVNFLAKFSLVNTKKDKKILDDNKL